MKALGCLFTVLTLAISTEVRVSSRIYNNVCINQGQRYWDYENFQPRETDWLDPEAFEVVRRLGSGRFSEVLEAEDTRSVVHRHVVLKVLKPVAAKKVNREIRILQILKGGSNVISLEGICRDTETGTTTLVLEHVGKDVQWLVSAVPSSHQSRPPPPLSLADIKFYMYKLLQALDYCHSCGIMHRDVKGRNVVINRRFKQLRLIDWGLSDFYIPGKRSIVRVGSRYFKAPELLVGYRFYSYAIDIFSAGCTLAGLVFRREPFFRGRDNEDQLIKITQVLGTENLYNYLKAYGIVLEEKLLDALGHSPKQDWKSLVTPDNESHTSVQLFDLLDKMLCYDHHERCTAKEAMAHPFFDDMRKEAEAANGKANGSTGG